MLHNYFFLRQFWLTNCSFFIYTSMPYIYPRLDSRIGPRFSDWVKVTASYLLLTAHIKNRKSIKAQLTLETTIPF